MKKSLTRFFKQFDTLVGNYTVPHRGPWCSGCALDLYSEGTKLESRLGHRFQCSSSVLPGEFNDSGLNIRRFLFKSFALLIYQTFTIYCTLCQMLTAYAEEYSCFRVMRYSLGNLLS